MTPAAVTGLIRTLAADAVGGLLALPVADTVKRADRSGRVEATVARDRLWLAQTPQMFRLEMLRTAYRAMSDATDEAGAIEALGLRPVLVMGEATNLKVTYPGDFAIAEAYLGLGSTNCPGNVPARPPTSVN